MIQRPISLTTCIGTKWTLAAFNKAFLAVKLMGIKNEKTLQKRARVRHFEENTCIM